MNRPLFSWLLAMALGIGSGLAPTHATPLKIYRETKTLMGSGFEIIAVGADSAQAQNAIWAAIKEIERIERLISSWDPHSQTSAINAFAGIKPVAVDNDLFELIRRAKKISQLTLGIFDISYASMDKIWKFDGSMTRLPTSKEMAVSVAKISHENILLEAEKQTVFLKEKGMKIGFGAMGKGYAANRAKTLMQSMGIVSGVVNAGGDLITWGRREDGQNWGIGITDPMDKDHTFSWLNISDQAVVTSGNYEKYVEFDGVRYGHIIHPKTGMPVAQSQSATVICPDAELADALATAVFILGQREGLALVNRLKGVECLLVNDQYEIAASKNLHLFTAALNATTSQLSTINFPENR